MEVFKAHAGRICDTLRRELGGIRAGRPSASLVEDIKVSYYNQLLPMKQLGSIGIAPPREIHIQVWDQGALPSVAKAIESSSLGLTANVEGSIIRIYLPELSAERREELARHVRRVAEEHRIQLRHARDEVNKRVQRLADEHVINEDQKFKLKEQVQREMDLVNRQVDETVAAKVREINL